MDYDTNYEENELFQDGKRKRLSNEESEILLEAFARNPRPNQDERNELAQKVGINSRNIQIWFQNRRAKLKRESNDPDLFSIRPAKLAENQENIVPLPVVTAGNFKELCLPKYLDIPIKGQQLTTEDIHKNEAIKKFWKKQQETTIETPSTTPTKATSRKMLAKQAAFTLNNTKKVKLSKQSTSTQPSDLKLEPFDMPDLLPFNNITNNSNKSTSSKLDCTNLTFLTQSVKDIYSQGVMKLNFYRPHLDTVATNVDFLFDPDKNSASLELLGNFKKSTSSSLSSSAFPSQIDQTFSEIFSSLPEMNL